MIATISSLGGEQELTGIVSVYIDDNETAHVYVGDTVAVTYSDCPNREEAIEMFEEDYEVEWNDA